MHITHHCVAEFYPPFSIVANRVFRRIDKSKKNPFRPEVIRPVAKKMKNQNKTRSYPGNYTAKLTGDLSLASKNR